MRMEKNEKGKRTSENKRKSVDVYTAVEVREQFDNSLPFMLLAVPCFWLLDMLRVVCVCGAAEG